MPEKTGGKSPLTAEQWAGTNEFPRRGVESDPQAPAAAKVDRQALIAAREATRTAPEIIAAVTAIEWAKKYDGAACPDNAISTETALAEWLRECLPEAIAEANALLTDLLTAEWAHWTAVKRSKGEVLPETTITAIYYVPREEVLFEEVTIEAEGRSLVIKQPVSQFHGASLEQVHAKWLALPADERPEHPLAPLIRAWQDRPKPVKPFQPVNRASLPALSRRAEHLPNLAFPASSKPPPAPLQMSLFDIDPPPHCPSWLLQMFDLAGGVTNEKGRGAPWPMRLFVSAFLHLPISQRNGEWRTLRFPQLRTHEADWPGDDVLAIERWLHPDGWANQRRDWHRLPEALQYMRQKMGWISVPGIGSVALLTPSLIPESPNDPCVEFTIRLPQSAAYGARIDWPTLQRYGLESARMYRAYLAVSEWLHLSARAGQPITQEIAPPILGTDGKPIRRKGGRIVRKLSRRVPNPAARFQRPLSDVDLAAMIGFDGTNRFRRRDALAAFEKLHEDGVIELRREENLWRIFGPKPGGK